MLPEVAEIFHFIFFTWAYVEELRDMIFFRETDQERTGIGLKPTREFGNAERDN